VRKLDTTDSVRLTRFELQTDDSVAEYTGPSDRLIVAARLAFELETPVDLLRIRDLAVGAWSRPEPDEAKEAWFIERLVGLDPDKEFAPEFEEHVSRAMSTLAEKKEPYSTIENILMACLAIERRWITGPSVHQKWIGVIAAFWLPYTDEQRIRLAPEDADDAVTTAGDLGVPLWIIEEGSLIASLLVVKKAYTAGKWMFAAYGTVRPRFTSATEASEWFVSNLRARALASKPRPIPLPRLDDSNAMANYPRNKNDIYFIYLHGLFSTDCGTFDGFVDAWQQVRLGLVGVHGDRAHTIFNRGCHIGWPHDTLAPINDNAEDLARLVLDRFGYTDAEIVLVCHSRGGLVARRAIQTLVLNSKAWAKRIACVVTFGTPHTGAEIAQVPGKYEGAYLLLLDGTRQMVALDMLFVYLRHAKRIDGIDDLAPNGNQYSKFLTNLQKYESSHPTCATIKVGGDIANGWSTPPTLNGILSKAIVYAVDKWLGTSSHDLVVTQQSSFGGPAGEDLNMVCSHFEYFEHHNFVQQVAINVADRLDMAIRVEQCVRNAGNVSFGTDSAGERFMRIDGRTMPIKS
jgi:hypothetical protein